MSNVRYLTSVAVPVAALAVYRPVAAQDLNVAYTGRTFGYLRYPDRLDLTDTACPTDESRLSTAAIDFLDLPRNRNADFQMLIGLGDNFAPVLEARRFLPAAGFPVPNPA